MPPNTIRYTPTTNDWGNPCDKATQPPKMQRSDSELRINSPEPGTQETHSPEIRILGEGVFNKTRRIAKVYVVKTPSTHAQQSIRREPPQPFLIPGITTITSVPCGSDSSDCSSEEPTSVQSGVSMEMTPSPSPEHHIDRDNLIEYCKAAFNDHLGTLKVHGPDSSYFVIFKKEDIGHSIKPFEGKKLTEEMLATFYSYRIITRYVPGKNLDDFFKENHSPIARTKAALAAAKALQNTLHKEKLMHGDLKGDNIRYDENTGDATFIDFDEHVEFQEPARTISARHKKSHWAPERRVLETKEFEPATAEMDVFSFGKMLNRFIKDGWIPQFPGFIAFIEKEILASEPEKRPSLEEIILFLQCELWLQKHQEEKQNDQALSKTILENKSFQKAQPETYNLIRIFALLADHKQLTEEHQDKLTNPVTKEIYHTATLAIASSEKEESMLHVKRSLSNAMIAVWDALSKAEPSHNIRLNIFDKAIRHNDLYALCAQFAAQQEAPYSGNKLSFLFTIVNEYVNEKTMKDKILYNILKQEPKKLIEMTQCIKSNYEARTVQPRSIDKKLLFKQFAQKQIVRFLQQLGEPEATRLQYQKSLKQELVKLQISNEKEYYDLRRCGLFGYGFFGYSNTLTAAQTLCKELLAVNAVDLTVTETSLNLSMSTL